MSNTKASPQKRVSGSFLGRPQGFALSNTLQNRLRQYLGSAAWLSREMSEQFFHCIQRSKPSLVTVEQDACFVKSVFALVETKG